MSAERSFPGVPASVPAARRFVLQTLSGLSAEASDAIALMVSELATNCVLHAGSDFRVTAGQTPGHVRVEVADTGNGDARMQSPAATEPHGRGLRIVDALSDDWGVAPATMHAGKAVWFVLRPGV